MLSKLFEKPRYLVAAVGFVIQLQAGIFTLVEPTLFSKSLGGVGALILAGGLHVELRAAAKNELRRVYLFFVRLKEWLAREAWGICVWTGVIAGIAFLATERSSTNYSLSTGKPYDMPQKDWDYVTKRLDQETNWNRKEAEEASRAVWKYEKVRRASDGN